MDRASSGAETKVANPLGLEAIYVTRTSSNRPSPPVPRELFRSWGGSRHHTPVGFVTPIARLQLAVVSYDGYRFRPEIIREARPEVGNVTTPSP